MYFKEREEWQERGARKGRVSGNMTFDNAVVYRMKSSDFCQRLFQVFDEVVCILEPNATENNTCLCELLINYYYYYDNRTRSTKKERKKY